MRWLNNIASRAAFGFAVVWGLTAVAVVGSVVLARDASDVLEGTLIGYADDLMHASQAQFAAERMVAVGRGYLLTREPELLARAKEAESDLDVSLHLLDRGDARPSERALLREVQSSASRYRQLLDQSFETTSATEDRAARANVLRDRLLPAREDLGVKLGTLVAHKQSLQLAARQRAGQMAARSVRVTTGLGALALILSAILAWLFTRRLGEVSRLERAMAQRATRALAAKEELLHVIAHDLRSPLTAIVLRAASMALGHRDEDMARSAAAIQSICERMRRLIQSLLDAATVDAGRISIAPARFPVETVIMALMETFGPEARATSVHLDWEVTPPQLAVWADRERINQILSNLVGNALKFTPAGGSIKIVVHEEGANVRFEVKDTGIGIRPENLPHVFERYWKSDVQARKGAGLGLYIAKGIVEGHKGRIWVDSSPGGGSSFQFELPVPEMRAEENRPSPATSHSPVVPKGSFAGRDQHAHG